MFTPPPRPPQSFRIVLELSSRQRLDGILLEQLRKQQRNSQLQIISRAGLKRLFKDKRVQMKGQSAVPSSAIAAGVSFIDILGFEDSSQEPAPKDS